MPNKKRESSIPQTDSGPTEQRDKPNENRKTQFKQREKDTNRFEQETSSEWRENNERIRMEAHNESERRDTNRLRASKITIDNREKASHD